MGKIKLVANLANHFEPLVALVDPSGPPHIVFFASNEKQSRRIGAFFTECGVRNLSARKDDVWQKLERRFLAESVHVAACITPEEYERVGPHIEPVFAASIKEIKDKLAELALESQGIQQRLGRLGR